LLQDIFSVIFSAPLDAGPLLDPVFYVTQAKGRRLKACKLGGLEVRQMGGRIDNFLLK